MMRAIRLRGVGAVTAGAAALLAAAVLVTPAAAQVAVRGGLVYTMTGPPIANGVVVLRDGKVAAVGPAASVAIPEGYRVLEAAVVTPGFIDAHSVVGLAGYLNQPHDQDQLDPAEPVQPELRAIDAYNAQERLVEWVRELGVTTIHTGHGPGALISGQTMIAKTRGHSAEAAVVVPEAMVAATLGTAGLDKRPGKSPGTRGKSVAMLRQKLLDARAYQRKMAGSDAEKRPARDLRMETLVRVLEGERPLLVTAHRQQDIRAALRLREEFGFRLVLDGGAEAYQVLDALKAAGVPVLVHPTMARAGAYGGDSDTENISMATAGKLRAAGVPFAFQSGYESYVPKTRVVPLEAAVATAFGLSVDDALAALTIDAARILGIDDRVGRLAPGLDGDLALFDGPPLEYLTHCIGVVIEGDVVSETAR
jgi:imidazolonepropionase-like amidohydrolase